MGVPVTVRFDEKRPVLVDGVPSGFETNEVFEVEAGPHVFELQGIQNYVPLRLTVNLSYTSQTAPSAITFKRS